MAAGYWPQLVERFVGNNEHCGAAVAAPAAANWKCSISEAK